MRRKFRSRFSLQTAFNNRKYITRRIRLTISTRPPIPRQLASFNLPLSSSLSLSLALLSPSPALSIFILLLARASGDNLHDRRGGIPELASVLRRHARLIRIRDTSPCALRVYSLLSQLDATLFAKQRTLSNKKSCARNAN